MNVPTTTSPVSASMTIAAVSSLAEPNAATACIAYTLPGPSLSRRYGKTSVFPDFDGWQVSRRAADDGVSLMIEA